MEGNKYLYYLKKHTHKHTPLTGKIEIYRIKELN